jgi:hypothetical protein
MLLRLFLLLALLFWLWWLFSFSFSLLDVLMDFGLGLRLVVGEI